MIADSEIYFLKQRGKDEYLTAFEMTDFDASTGKPNVDTKRTININEARIFDDEFYLKTSVFSLLIDSLKSLGFVWTKYSKVSHARGDFIRLLKQKNGRGYVSTFAFDTNEERLVITNTRKIDDAMIFNNEIYRKIENIRHIDEMFEEKGLVWVEYERN